MPATPQRPLLAATLFVPLLLGAACSGPRPPAAPPRAAPADFVFSFGEGGGFTGQWYGFTIQADGTVLRWQGRAAGEHPQPAGRLTPAQVDTLWAEVQAARFFARHVQEPGNLTGYMRAVAAADTNTVLWPRGSDREDVLPALRALYHLAGRLVQTRTE